MKCTVQQNSWQIEINVTFGASDGTMYSNLKDKAFPITVGHAPMVIFWHASPSRTTMGRVIMEIVALKGSFAVATAA